MSENQLTIPFFSDASRAALHPAIQLQRRGDLKQASKLAIQALTNFPNCAATSYLNYQLAVASHNLEAAEQCLQTALKLHPEHPLLCLQYAQLKYNQYYFSESLQYIERAAEAYTGNDVPFLATLAQLALQIEKPTVAAPLFTRLVAVEPAHQAFKYQLALCYFYSNQAEQAAALLNDVLSVSPNSAGAIHLRSALQKYSPEHNHIESLEQLIAGDCAKEPAVYYALAKELEDVGDYKRSMAVLKQGAELMRAQVKYNEAAELAAMKGIITSTQGMHVPDTNTNQPGPIFIVGMPRSGTTLVERILAQHDDVAPIGEFSLFPQLLARMANEFLAKHPDKASNLHEASLQLDFAELGKRYMAAATNAADGKPSFIDKLPVNFMYCGFIKKALPNAKIVHLCREPMDACYAIFKTLFINTYSFSYNLDELANYYATYQKLMVHWHQVMPAQIFDIHYEQLVSDAAAQVKALSDYCGLAYNDEMLAFHSNDKVSTTASAAQIRKPIYTSSVEKWRHFEKELQPLAAKLTKLGVLG